MKEQEIFEEVRSVRNNNPGNLRAVGSDAQRKLTQPGYVLDRAIGFDKDGFAIFPDKETGMSAMQRQLRIDAGRGMTGTQMINKYAGRGDNTPLGRKYPNNPEAYVDNVFTKAGLDPNKPIDPKDLDTIQKRMIAQEGGARASEVYGGVSRPQDAQMVAQEPKSPEEEDIISRMNLAKRGMEMARRSWSSAMDIGRRVNQGEQPQELAAMFKMAENTVRFKDLRRAINEHIIEIDSKEQIEEGVGAVGKASIGRAIARAKNLKSMQNTKLVVPVENVQSGTTRSSTEKTPAAVIDIKQK